MHSEVRMRTGRSLDRMLESKLPGEVSEIPGGSATGGGVSAPRGVWSGGNVCSLGVCLLWGGVCLLPGGSGPGGVSAPRGALVWGVVSQHALRQTPHPPP